MQGLGLELPAGAPLSIFALVVSLGIGTVLAIVLRWHFERFGSTLSNRSEFAQVFPMIVLTTVLIITVVKSSLALSLGLVGALSIVRFRTPIKEPEELAYLFIAIGMGLGLGADQHVATVVAGTLILSVVALLRWGRRGREHTGLYLSVDWRETATSPLEGLSEIVSAHAVAADLRRVDARDGGYEVTYFIDVQGTEVVSAMVDALQQRFPGVGVTFVDQNQLPSV
jgi:hypothetical protein